LISARVLESAAARHAAAGGSDRAVRRRQGAARADPRHLASESPYNTYVHRGCRRGPSPVRAGRRSRRRSIRRREISLLRRSRRPAPPFLDTVASTTRRSRGIVSRGASERSLAIQESCPGPPPIHPWRACYKTRAMSRSTALSATSRRGRRVEPVPVALPGAPAPGARRARRWFALRVEGLEPPPAAGPYIVAANHHNYLDGVLLAVALPAPIAFLVMPRVWRATPLHPWLHRRLGSIPLALRAARRRRPAHGAARPRRRARGRHLSRGTIQRPRAARARPVRRGLLALRAGAPVVPAGISGTYQALVGRRRLHSAPASARRPLRRAATVSRRGPRPRRPLEDHARIMDDIAALLP